MRHAEAEEYRRAKREHSLAASGGVAERKVYEGFSAADRSAVGICHL